MKKANPYFRDPEGRMFTYCKDCKFLKLDKTCELGRLAKWQALGKYYKESQEGYPEIYTICTAYRDWQYQGGPEDVYQELEMKIDIIVIVDSDDNDHLDYTIDSIVNSDLKPVRVIFLNRTSLDDWQLVQRLKEYETFHNNMLWSVVSGSPEELLGVDIDEAVIRCNSPYYAVFKVGTEIPWDYLRKRDNNFNRELLEEMFVHSPNDFPEFTFVYRGLHNEIGGWSPEKFQHEETKELITCESLLEKLELLEAKQTKCE